MQTLRLFVPPLAQIWLLLCIGLGSTWAASGERLPVGVVPLAYTLDLTIVPDQPNFKGKTEIDVTLAAVTSRIQMHGRGLVASEAFVQLPDGRRIAATFAEDGDTGYASLTTVEAVGPGPAKIVISYSGAISKSLNGLYSVKHKNLTYAYTQMESIYARQVFPSFDEPKFKTPFTFSITHPADQIAISNGPETAKTDAGDGMTRTNFATTQPLPTYLTAIAVGEFDVVTWEALPPNEVRKRAIPLRGIAPKGDGSKLNYALLNTRSLFEVQEKWFGIAYPYAKLDLVAVHRMQAGGMENAGAIFYRANLLLLPPEASVYAQRSYAFVHAHELAHSWFGNYVTPNWWDDIWLNESFATWFGNKSLNLWQPTNYRE